MSLLALGNLNRIPWTTALNRATALACRPHISAHAPASTCVQVSVLSILCVCSPSSPAPSQPQRNTLRPAGSSACRRPISAHAPALRCVQVSPSNTTLRMCSTFSPAPSQLLHRPLSLWQHSLRRCSSAAGSTNVESGSGKASWDAQWQAFTDILDTKGFGGGDSGAADWGATKRTVLSFARASGDDALNALGCSSDVAALTAAPISYTDRKVKNARLRLIRFTGAAPPGSSPSNNSSPCDVAATRTASATTNPAGSPAVASGIGDIGRASFQDVCRLLMAIHLEGPARQPDAEAAGSRVLQHVCQLAQDGPQAPPTPAPPPEGASVPAGTSSLPAGTSSSSPGTGGRPHIYGAGRSGRRGGKSRQRSGDDSSGGPREPPSGTPRGPRRRHGGSATSRWKRAGGPQHNRSRMVGPT